MTQRHGVATKENRFCRGVGVKRQTCRPYDKGTKATPSRTLRGIGVRDRFRM